MTDVATISTKGQVVIPQHIREELDLEEGSQVVIGRMDDFVIVKKVNIPDLKKEFRKLTEQGKKQVKKLGLKDEEDVVRIIHESRKAKH